MKIVKFYATLLDVKDFEPMTTKRIEHSPEAHY